MTSQKHKSASQDHDRGAALITALILVAVMSISVIGLLDVMRFSFKASANLAQREQARLYAIGAEKLAASTLSTARGQEERRSYPLLDYWTREPFVFPIDGGSIMGNVSDGANCFNLNSVVTQSEGVLVRSDFNADRFEQLLERLDIQPGQASELAGALVDWMDNDQTPSFGGAEDYEYGARAIPYRTSGQMLADVSELRAIVGYSEEVMAVLMPHVCAYQNHLLQPLNMNTISVEDTPIVLAYLGRQFDPQTVVDIIAERPVDGFSRIEDFFGLSIFTQDFFDDGLKEYFALKSEFYSVTAIVRHYQTALALNSTLTISSSGDVTVQSRRYGIE